MSEAGWDAADHEVLLRIAVALEGIQKTFSRLVEDGHGVIAVDINEDRWLDIIDLVHGDDE